MSMVRWCVSRAQSCAINYVDIDFGCIRILRTSSLPQLEVGDPQCPPVLGLCSNHKPILQDLFLRQKNTWRAVHRPTQQLMLRNVSAPIIKKIQQNHHMMQESGEGSADNHDAVHAELERQLSTRQLSIWNLRRGAVQEQTPLNNRTGCLEQYLQSQDASQRSELSFDYHHALFAQAL